ncbi:DeoR/GlpR family DNA-binding transcription regulator [Paramicrobacterium chengjingii]|uniref:DeoR/GlpR transcriptional regulator n=1 Tax=Paramicrobacterium chengjingii TaxID=2769067 RepID=A0ABX6YHG0_9MICO|nr:DeoR/GlpR family DNA-binding transcription regulator [Microbacterium chengjingii]QPZ38234.1 DeoR/GlpR transcriptional regulator [Microbacterium chengjingii]
MAARRADASPLIPDQRREAIMRHLRRDQVLSFKQLSDLLGVSHMTIRRDVSQLEEDGHAISIPGGAKIASRLVSEPSHEQKTLIDSAEKAAMAQLASSIVRPSMAIYLDAGTTMLAMVPMLAEIDDLTIVTNDLMTAHSVLTNTSAELITVGGRVDRDNQSTVGLLAANMLDDLAVDIALLSTSSWDLRHGVTTPSEAKVEVKRAALRMSSQAVLVAGSSKYGSFGKYKALDLSEVDIVVTDGGLSDGAAAGIRALNVDVRQAIQE